MSTTPDSLGRWWRRLWPVSSAQRLNDILPTYRRDLAFLIQSTTTPGGKPAWASEAEQLLDLAEQAVRDRNPERGWRHFHAAQRLELHGLRALGPEAFRARAQSIRAEALQKLRSWRRKQVEELFGALPAPGTPPAPVSPAELAAASESALLLHEHFSNEAMKQGAAQAQTRVVVGLALGAILLWLRLAGPRVFKPLAAAEQLTWDDPGLLGSALAFGLMGASFSALTSLAGQSSSPQTIPEQVFTYRITLARQAVGVLSALVVVVLLASDFLQIRQLPMTPSLVLLAAFAAGFSERLVVRALERFAGAADGSKGK
jgi:hypothetical protein